MSNFNLLKIKSKNNNFYVFDAINNNIYKIESEEDWIQLGISDFGHETDIRKNALYFKGTHEIVASNAKTLIVELTEECNIRCTYCVFDESDKTERNHSTKDMPQDLALKSVENFFKRTNGEESYLVFYGGEPLLNYSLLKLMVSHANEISRKKIKFSFTTNGISLTKEKFDFLIENDFRITISIDGPQPIHDKRRVSKNGKGTFSIVEKNILELVDYNNNFYYKNVDFNCTISDFKDVQQINAFFKTSNIFKRENVRFSPVISKSIDLDRSISLSVSDADLRSVLRSGGSATFKNSANDNIDPIQDSFIGDIVRKIKFRELDDEAKNGKKICIPFVNRTYVRASGETQFCERIQSYELLDNQENLESVSKKIYEIFYDFKVDSCSKCFAYNFCEMCPASFMANGNFNEEISLKKCSSYRENVKKAMSIYIDSMESLDQ